tara:strand:- start:159 stop:398 length:240 start_codon:yes stop_codon:yes gene_type:complete
MISNYNKKIIPPISAINLNNHINLQDSGSINNSKKSPKVNINLLMSKIRDEEKKSKIVNLGFFSLAITVLLVSGIILSF